MKFISEHKAAFGVEPICAVLSGHGAKIAPSTYYDAVAAAARPSRWALRDADLKSAITRVHEANYGVYGPRKVWLALNREGVPPPGARSSGSCASWAWSACAAASGSPRPDRPLGWPRHGRRIWCSAGSSRRRPIGSGWPTSSATWMADVTAERKAAQERERVLAERPRQMMTRAEITTMIDSVGDLVRALQDADRADKAELYGHLGVQLTYHPA